MGHGLGRQCKRVLEMAQRHDGRWVRLTSKAATASEASSLRRAAHTLERRGLIDVKSYNDKGLTRLVVRLKRGEDEILPPDLAQIMSKERRDALLADYARLRSLGSWQEAVSDTREQLKEALWQAALRTGLNIDQLVVVMSRKWQSRGLHRRI